MKNLKKVIFMIFLIMMFGGLISCEWFENPDDNPNRPDNEGARWGESHWGADRWN